MENALLYTFSTIAQTLGGAIALLSAFVLYRFQSLDDALDRDTKTLRDGFTAHGGKASSYEELEAERQYLKILELLKTEAAHGNTYSVPIFKRLKHGIERKKRITDAFMAALLCTGTGMMLSILMLPITHVLVARPAAAVLVLLAGVVIFTACIWIYWLVISAALGLRKFRDEVSE
jgi:hypothetical protein